MRETDHSTQDDAPATAAAVRLPAAAGGDVARMVLRMQTTIGNRATGRVLARSYKDDVKAFREQIRLRHWSDAAARLNGFDPAAISDLISDLEYDELVAIENEGRTTFANWPDSFQKKATQALAEWNRANAVREAYDKAAAIPDWDKMALQLNGMTIKDIDKRLKNLTTLADLGKLDDAVTRLMGSWPPKVHPRITARMAEVTSTGDIDQEAFAKHPPTAGSATFSADAEAKLRKDPRKAAWLDMRDGLVQRLGAVDYEDYVQNMLVDDVSAFGVKILNGHPVHPLFAAKLVTATAKASAMLEARGKPKDAFGIQSISGHDNRPGNHSWGLAVDINTAGNPYIMNESGHEAVDALTAPVYERIARTLLGRASVITPGARATPASWAELAEESDAMAAYFSGLSGDELTGGDPKKTPNKRKGALTGRVFPPDTLAKLDHAQVQKDYDTLLGRLPGTTDPSVFPFVGSAGPSARNPTLGFLTISEEAVIAMRSLGLRWGAVDFGGASGDVMHFDDNISPATVDASEYARWGKAHQTAKRQAAARTLAPVPLGQSPTGRTLARAPTPPGKLRHDVSQLTLKPVGIAAAPIEYAQIADETSKWADRRFTYSSVQTNLTVTWRWFDGSDTEVGSTTQLTSDLTFNPSIIRDRIAKVGRSAIGTWTIRVEKDAYYDDVTFDVRETRPLTTMEGETTQSWFNVRDLPGGKVLGTLSGQSVPITIDSKAKVNGDVYYHVTFKADTGEQTGTKAPFPAGSQAWIVGKALTQIMSWDTFRAELSAWETANATLSLDERITRLRQMSHNSDLPFDDVIGTGSAAKGTYLDQRPYKPGDWDILVDAQMVRMPDGRVVEVQHLLVGLDVLPRPDEHRSFHEYGLSVDVGQNYSAATWAGDVGAGAADAALTFDKEWESHNPGATMTDHVKRYYWTRLPTAELTGDIDAWGIDAGRSAAGAPTTIEGLLLDYYGAAAVPDVGGSFGKPLTHTPKRKAAVERFLGHYGFTFSRGTVLKTQTTPRQAMLDQIVTFGVVWLKNRVPWYTTVDAAMVGSMTTYAGLMVDVLLGEIQKLGDQVDAVVV